MLDTYKKQNISLILICVIVSIMTSSFCSFLFTPRNQTTNTTNQTQTINVNQPDVEKVDVNEATKEELMSLPGIGEEKAELIIGIRPIFDIWEISKIKGIGDKTFLQIKDRIEVIR